MKAGKKPSRFHIALITIIVVVIILLILNSLYTDYLWFSEVGYESVFLKVLTTRIIIFLVSAIIFFLVIAINMYIAQQKQGVGLSLRLKLLILGIISLFFGLSYQGNWQTILSYINRTDFGLQDPIFSNDISFYTFTLPIFNLVWSFIALIVTSGLYW